MQNRNNISLFASRYLHLSFEIFLFFLSSRCTDTMLSAIKTRTKETWPLKKVYILCTDPSFPDFLLVRQNSFTTAYPMNCPNKLVWQLGSVHKIHVHLEATRRGRKKFYFLRDMPLSGGVDPPPAKEELRGHATYKVKLLPPIPSLLH